MLDVATGVTPAQRQRILAHYKRVAPLIGATFGGAPLVYAGYPNGFEGSIAWHGPIGDDVPADVATVVVDGPHGRYRYLALSTAELDRLCQRAGAVEFHGWGCTADDPERAAFARILLEHDAPPAADGPRRTPAPRDAAKDAETLAALADGALLLRGQLHDMRLQAIPLLTGTNGIALWIPLSDGPQYVPLRAWLHAICNEAVRRYPQRFSTEPNTHASGRIHLHVGTNAPGRYSALPYSLRGDNELRVCAPVTWDEIASLPQGALAFNAQSIVARLDTVGDVFARQLGEIGEQRFPTLQSASAAAGHGKPIEHHGHILQAALTILQDGVARDAKVILDEALTRKLVPPGTQPKYVYTSLLEYIVRTSGHGHRPAIVQDVDRRFRINEPPDPWPAVDAPSVPPLSAQAQAIGDRLAETVRGSDPAAFELAVCDAFAHLGFAATHIGGNDAPDGYADAQLGPLGYRVMLECKTGGLDVTDPDAVEASKYRDAYHAQYCALIGPGFAENTELGSELQTHGVSAWSVDDLQRLLAIVSNPHEMLALFAPGFVGDVIDTLQWERLHGEGKRVRLICDYLLEAGWAAQVAAAKQGPPQNAPRLTVDAAMLLVDQRLASEGSAASCARDEVEAAFAYLTNPRVGTAVWVDPETRDAIVIVEASSGTAAVTE